MAHGTKVVDRALRRLVEEHRVARVDRLGIELEPQRELFHGRQRFDLGPDRTTPVEIETDPGDLRQVCKSSFEGPYGVSSSEGEAEVRSGPTKTGQVTREVHDPLRRFVAHRLEQTEVRRNAAEHRRLRRDLGPLR